MQEGERKKAREQEITSAARKADEKTCILMVNQNLKERVRKITVQVRRRVTE